MHFFVPHDSTEHEKCVVLIKNKSCIMQQGKKQPKHRKQYLDGEFNKTNQPYLGTFRNMLNAKISFISL